MEYKKCFKCNTVKIIDDFYKHNQMSDGHINKCKDCAKLDSRKTRASRIEYYRDCDRKRARIYNSERYKKRIKQYPEQYKANYTVSNYIRDGKLTRPSYCQGCGNKCVPHGHHEDYSKPLDLVWLCSSCHCFLHKMYVFKKEI